MEEKEMPEMNGTGTAAELNTAFSPDEGGDCADTGRDNEVFLCDFDNDEMYAGILADTAYAKYCARLEAPDAFYKKYEKYFTAEVIENSKALLNKQIGLGLKPKYTYPKVYAPADIKNFEEYEKIRTGIRLAAETILNSNLNLGIVITAWNDPETDKFCLYSYHHDFFAFENPIEADEFEHQLKRHKVGLICTSGYTARVNESGHIVRDDFWHI